MHDVNGRQAIRRLQKRWSVRLWVARLLMMLSCLLFIAVIAFLFFPQIALWIVVSALLLLVVLFWLLPKPIAEAEVAAFLNRSFPRLEESVHLFLLPAAQLNSLQQWQLKKINFSGADLHITPPSIRRQLASGALLLLGAVALSAVLWFRMPPKQDGKAYNTISRAQPIIPEKKLPGVQSVSVQITPPAYTGKPSYVHQSFSISAEEEALVQWHITTNRKAEKVELLFNDKSRLKLVPTGTSQHTYSASQRIRQTGFYQVLIDNQLSPLYKIEMIKDEAPQIVVQSPKSNTFIEYGKPRSVLVDVVLSDDYGIYNTSLQTTVASGSGEAVTFTEKPLAFARFQGGARHYHLQQVVNLTSLGMQSGDELYFYIKAEDNHHTEKRSDVFVVRLEDTAQLMSMSGLVSALDVKPELFRSERQIIIEAEQLLRDKDTISVEKFNNKSADLGVDQKLLRLRYGKFLGEENETEIAGGAAGEHDHGSEISEGDAAEHILDAYSHKHDIAEDATFFDEATKKQLKATLDEMWKAELKLRTYKPKEALPFAYNALRLLKDLQQQTRSYVAKTGVKTTPLNPAKRLSGELAEITEPVQSMRTKREEDNALVLRKALAVLDAVRNKKPWEEEQKKILEEASVLLGKAAASNPTVYLTAFESLQKVLDRKAATADFINAGRGCQSLIAAVVRQPQQSSAAPGKSLSQQYFIHLKQQHD